MKRNFVLFFLAVLFFSFFSSQESLAQTNKTVSKKVVPRKSSDSRRTLLSQTETLTVFELPPYVGESSTAGMKKQTASAWGIDGAHGVIVWNECGSVARQCVLLPGAELWADNGPAFVEGYLVGCTKNGKAYMNRVRLVLIPDLPEPKKETPPPATPVPTEKKAEEPRVPPPCAECPEVAYATSQQKSTKKNRFLGGMLKSGLEGLASAGVTAATTRGNLEDTLTNGGIAFGASRLKRAVKPPPNLIEIQVEGIRFRLQKGVESEHKALSNGRTAYWMWGNKKQGGDPNAAYLWVSFPEGKTKVCGQVNLKEDQGFILIFSRRSNSTVRFELAKPVPGRPGGPGLPTRPSLPPL